MIISPHKAHAVDVHYNRIGESTQTDIHNILPILYIVPTAPKLSCEYQAQHTTSRNSLPFQTRIDVYETLCPQQMLVHKGGKIKNWGGECRDVTPTKSLSQNIRVDVNREVKFL